MGCRRLSRRNAVLGGLLMLGLGIAATAATVGPEEQRKALIDLFRARFPDIRLEDYAYGALSFDPDAKAQYQSIMEFPPFTAELEQGERLWRTPFRNGRTYADCMPGGGRMIAGNYPVFDAAKGRVVTFQDLINDCRQANGEEPYDHADMKTMGLLTAYARSLSDGMKVQIKVEGPAAMAAFEDGRRTFYRRFGQLNFSCAQCHVDNAGNRLRSEILAPAVGQAAHWPVFRGGDQVVTLQHRYFRCFDQVRHVPDKEGSIRFNNLEYFHTYLSNGLELKSGVFRR